MTSVVSKSSSVDSSASSGSLSNETKKALLGLGQFVVRNKYVLDSILQLVPQKDSDGLSSSIVQTYDHFGGEETLKERAIDFIEVDKNSDVVAFLRENSLAVTVLSKSFQLYGRNYIKEVVQHRIKKILKSKLTCEIDPARLESPEDLPKNLHNLIKVTKSMLTATWKSSRNIPFFIKDALIKIDQKLKPTGTTPLQIVGTLFFLRFITPVVSGADTKASKDHSRTLILVAKLIQLIANKISVLETSNFLKATEPFLAVEIPKAELFAEVLLDVSETADNRQVKTRSSRDIDRAVFDIYLWLKKNSDSVEDYLIRNFGEASCNSLREHMRAVHTSFGSDVTVAEDWQKVWKRVQRLKVTPVASSESMGYSDTTSELTSTETEGSTTDDTSSQTLDVSPSEDEPSLNIIIKCFHQPSKKLKFVMLDNPNFVQFVETVQKKFKFAETKPLHFSYVIPNAGIDGEGATVNVEDETSFNEFLDNQGTQHAATIIYSIWIQ